MSYLEEMKKKYMPPDRSVSKISKTMSPFGAEGVKTKYNLPTNRPKNASIFSDQMLEQEAMKQYEMLPKLIEVLKKAKEAEVVKTGMADIGGIGSEYVSRVAGLKPSTGVYDRMRQGAQADVKGATGNITELKDLLLKGAELGMKRSHYDYLKKKSPFEDELKMMQLQQGIANLANSSKLTGLKVKEAEIKYNSMPTPENAKVLQQLKLDEKRLDIKTQKLRNENTEAQRKLTEAKTKSEGLKKGKGKKSVTATTASAVGELISTPKMLDFLHEDYMKSAGTSFKAFKTKIRGTKEYIYDNQRKMAAQTVGKILEGGKLTDPDFFKYYDMLPDPFDTNYNAKRKIESLKKLLSIKLSGQVQGLTASGYDTEDLQTLIESLSSKTPTQKGTTTMPQRDFVPILRPGYSKSGYKYTGPVPSSADEQEAFKKNQKNWSKE